MNNQECKVRPKIISVNSDKPVYYPFSIKTSKCSCGNVFNLMSRTNEIRHIKYSMKRVNVNLDQMQVFVIINNVGMMINAGVNIKN